jgi:hypothetical protein
MTTKTAYIIYIIQIRSSSFDFIALLVVAMEPPALQPPGTLGSLHAERVRRVVAKLESDGVAVNAELKSIQFCYDEIFAAQAIFDRPGLTISAYLDAAARFFKGLYYQHYGEFSSKIWINLIEAEEPTETAMADLVVARLAGIFNIVQCTMRCSDYDWERNPNEYCLQDEWVNSQGMMSFVDMASKEEKLDLLQRRCGVEARTVITDFVAVLLTEYSPFKEDPSNMRKALDILRRNAEMNPNRPLSKLKLVNVLLKASEVREAYAIALQSSLDSAARGWSFTASNLLLKAAMAVRHGALGNRSSPDAVGQLVDRAQELFEESYADLWLPPVARNSLKKGMKRLKSESGVLPLGTPVNLPLVPLYLRECRSCHVRSLEMKRCKLCKNVFYCTKECQVKDWGRHKAECQIVQSSS